MNTFLILLLLSLFSLFALFMGHRKLKSVVLLKNTALSFRGFVKAICLTTLIWGLMTISVVAFPHSATPSNTAADTSTPTVSQTTAAASTNSANTTIGNSTASTNKTTTAQTVISNSTTATKPATQSTTNPTVPSAAASASTTPSTAASTSAASSAKAATTSKYVDGTYTGTSNGYRGPMTVSITIQGGMIVQVNVTDNQDDARWFDRANSVIPQSIVQAQSTQVDTVSGATYSSKGIIAGAANALSKALSSATQ